MQQEDIRRNKTHKNRIWGEATGGQYQKQDDWEKMQAFVNFEIKESHGQVYYQAWYEPEFPLERACAGYFRDRFAFTAWAVTTPEVILLWTGSELIYEEGKFDQELAAWKVRRYLRRNFSDSFEEACLGA